MRTSLKHFPTIPATLFYGSSLTAHGGPLHELGADSDVWDLMRWPSRQPTFDELPWVAGLFEGEGSLCDSHVCIPENERDVLDRVRRLVGGRVGGPYLRRQHGGRQTSYYLWYASGPRSRGIARTLFHLLSTRRREQARLFLRIPRDEEPPKLSPADPTRLLWDWAPNDELEQLER